MLMLRMYLFDMGNCLSQTWGQVLMLTVYLFDMGNCLSQTRGTSVNVEPWFLIRDKPAQDFRSSGDTTNPLRHWQ